MRIRARGTRRCRRSTRRSGRRCRARSCPCQSGDASWSPASPDLDRSALGHRPCSDDRDRPSSLPDRTIDPWGGLNPFKIWFFTVIVAAISFVALLSPQVIAYIIGPAIAGGLVLAVAGTALLLLNSAHNVGDQPARNPFELGTLLVFAAALRLFRPSAPRSRAASVRADS